ncbi:hypothetical protein HQ42_00350 [Porphyromonas gulae]|nr:hypothetical protein HQ42_00350 [Porphyromonas gulae]
MRCNEDRRPTLVSCSVQEGIVRLRLFFNRCTGCRHSGDGLEFMAFNKIEKTPKVSIYFARRYTSTDKPHIEHLNALTRQYLPKGVSFIEDGMCKLFSILD